MKYEDLPITRSSTAMLSRVMLPDPFDTWIDYEADPGEREIRYPVDDAHPGYPPSVEIYHVWVHGVDIYEWLVPEQIEKITEAVLALHDWSHYED
mgnify:CR=1 FL=1